MKNTENNKSICMYVCEFVYANVRCMSVCLRVCVMWCGCDTYMTGMFVFVYVYMWGGWECVSIYVYTLMSTIEWTTKAVNKEMRVVRCAVRKNVETAEYFVTIAIGLYFSFFHIHTFAMYYSVKRILHIVIKSCGCVRCVARQIAEIIKFGWQYFGFYRMVFSK